MWYINLQRFSSINKTDVLTFHQSHQSGLVTSKSNISQGNKYIVVLSVGLPFTVAQVPLFRKQQQLPPSSSVSSFEYTTWRWLSTGQKPGSNLFEHPTEYQYLWQNSFCTQYCSTKNRHFPARVLLEETIH